VQEIPADLWNEIQGVLRVYRLMAGIKICLKSEGEALESASQVDWRHCRGVGLSGSDPAAELLLELFGRHSGSLAERYPKAIRTLVAAPFGNRFHLFGGRC
jgi:hypothetical protein